MTSSLVRHALAAAFLASTALVAAPALAQTAAAPLSFEALSTELQAALAQANAAGDASLLATVYENVRLTPFRGPAVVDEARRLQPEMGLRIETAARLAYDHARLASAAAPLAGAPAANAAPRALPPGADAAVDLANVSEFNRNFGLGLIGTQTALDKGLTGKGVVVAVIDSGIDRTTGGRLHTEFAGRLDPRSTSGYHWFSPTLALNAQSVAAGFVRPSTATEDPNGHGTHVAGIIGAARDGQGMQGVAPEATILSVQGITSFPKDNRVTGGEFTIGGTKYDADSLSRCGSAAYLTNNADCTRANPNVGPGTENALKYVATQTDVRVINGSFGPNIADGTKTWAVTPDELNGEANAVRAVLKAGQILAVAAGNDGLSAPVSAESPTGIGLFPFINPNNATRTHSTGDRIYSGADTVDFSDMTDAALSAAEKASGTRYGRIIAVVATDANKQIAGYSNRCGVAAEWCIAAPGGAGDGNTGQSEIYSAYPNQTYKDINGTSMATPHVAGAVAVLIQAFPTYSPAQITNILFQTAEDIGAPGTDAIYGRGFLRLDRALNSGPAGLNPASKGDFVAGRNEAKGARTVWTVPVRSQGALEKEGDGEIVVAGDASFEAGVDVEDGELQVDGNLTTPDIDVKEQGTLSGNGTINGAVVSNGTLAPGNSPGLLTVNGNVTLQSLAKTEIEIDGPSPQIGAGGYDRILVAGAGHTFTAAGTVSPTTRGIAGAATNSYTPPIGQGFVFVSVPDGSVAGSFAGIVQPATGVAAGSRFEVVYGARSLTLVSTPASYANLSPFGLSPSANARSLAAAIESVRPAAGLRPSAAAAPFFASLYLTDAASLATGLDQAAGRVNVDAGQASLRSVGRFADALGERQTALALLGDAAPGAGLRYWTEGDAGSAAVGGYDVDSYGGTFGADMALEGGGLIGGAFRYENGDLDAGLQGAADIDTYQGALYGSTPLGGLDLGLAAGLSYGTIDTVRAVSLGGGSIVSGETDGVGGLVEARLSKTYDFGGTMVLPSLAAGYRAFERDAATETGAFALSLPGRTFDEAYVQTGFAVSRSFALRDGLTLKPTLTVAYRGDLDAIDDTSAHDLLGTAFATVGTEIGRHAFVGGASLEISRSETFSFAASYDVDLRKNLQEHTVTGSLRFRW